MDLDGYITTILDIKSRIDPYWDGAAGYFKTPLAAGGTQAETAVSSCWAGTVAMLAHLDTTRGTTNISATDKTRARTIAAKLSSSPCYANAGWTNLMDGSGSTHPFWNFTATQGLFWCYRYASDISWSNSSELTAASNALTVNTTGTNAGYNPSNVTTPNSLLLNYTLTGAHANVDGQDILGFHHNRRCMAAILGSPPADFASGYKAYIDNYMLRQRDSLAESYVYNSQQFFKDWGWMYTTASSFQMDQFQSWNYGNFICASGLVFYPDVASTLSLTAGQKAKLTAWLRSQLGTWAYGYPNWHDVWSNGRAFNLGSACGNALLLVAVMRNVNYLNMGQDDHEIARGMLDSVVDLWNTADTFAGDADDGLVPRYPWAPAYGGSDGQMYPDGKYYDAAYFAYALAIGAVSNLNLTGAKRANVFTYHWTNKDLYVGTPKYAASILPYAPKVGSSYGGTDTGNHADAVQLQHWGPSSVVLGAPAHQWVTAFGGYGEGRAPTFRVTRDGTTEIDTSAVSGGTGYVAPTASLVIDGTTISPSDYDTSSIPIEFTTADYTVSGSGSNYSLQARTVFKTSQFTTTYTITRTGASGTVGGILTIPGVQTPDSRCIVKAHNGSTLTTIWNGTTALSKSAPTYIHQTWGTYGLLWKFTYTNCTGLAMMHSSIPAATYSREARRDRAALLTIDAGTLTTYASVAVTVKITDGTDADAALKAGGAALTITPTANWAQNDSSITVRGALVGVPVGTSASITSDNGGWVVFGGTHASRFEASSDNATWAPNLLVAAGTRTIYVRATRQSGDPTLTAAIGVPE